MMDRRRWQARALVSSRGVTLIELLVVVSIGLILLFVVVPSFTDFIRLQRLRSTAAQIVTDFQFAKAEAAARNELGRIRYSLNTDVSCYVIYTAVDNSKLCDCRNGAGSACSDPGTRELRTFSVRRDSRIVMGLPSGSPAPPESFAFHQATGALYAIPTDLGIYPIPLAGLIVGQTSTTRRISVLINQAGRVTRCRPSTSTVTGEALC